MTTIVSKRHPIKFYFSIILVTIFVIGIGLSILFFYQDFVNKGQLKPTEKLMPVFSMAFFVIAVYSVYQYFKNAPIITLDKDFITFNNQRFLLTDIKDVILTGKQPFKYGINFPMEGAKLTFNSGETKYIFDDIYSNSWEMKLFIKRVVIDKNNFLQGDQSTIDKNAVARDFYETFKGNQLTSLRGISLWGVVLIFAYMFLNDEKPHTPALTIFLFGFSAFWFFLHSHLMNYFQVSDNFFVVRNHNYFWKKRVYNIFDIEEIVFETRSKMPNCLRVITKDFRNNLYPAATLQDATWLDLKDKLETLKIKVRNECI